MFIIFDDERFAQGATLDKAIDDWKDIFGQYPELTKLTIVKGVKQKLTFTLEPIIEKPVEKQVVNKTTKVK